MGFRVDVVFERCFGLFGEKFVFRLHGLDGLSCVGLEALNGCSCNVVCG